MYLQNQIFQWLQSLTIDVLKHVLTIKNPANSIYIKRILSQQPEAKPMDRKVHGYSETKVNNQKVIYIRDKYRYKKKKEEKNAMDEKLFENITVSRLNPWSFSLKKDFIKSNEFRECLMLFSDEQIFNFTDLKQRPVKLGEEKQMRSIWFDPSFIKSFSEWLVHLFENEIREAYLFQKQNKTDLNKQPNQFTYAAQYISLQLIYNRLRLILHTIPEKRHNGRLLVRKTGKNDVFFCKDQEHEEFEQILEAEIEEKPYLLKLCMEKLQDEKMGVEQAIFEYIWTSEERTSKPSRVLKDFCKIVMRKFKEFQFNIKANQIQALAQSGKKKKKKVKKVGQENQALQLQKPQKATQIAELQMNQAKVEELLTPAQEIQNSAELLIERNQIIKESQEIANLNRKIEEKLVIIEDSVPRQKDAQVSQPLLAPIQENLEKAETKKKKKNKNTKSSRVQQTQIAKQETGKIGKQESGKIGKQEKGKIGKQETGKIDKQETGKIGKQETGKIGKQETGKQAKPQSNPNSVRKQGQKLLRKVVRQRINEQIAGYYKQLVLHSQSIDKYRKICLQLIQSSIAEMELKFKWQLQLFGSYSIDFALRQSDLDLVIIVQKSEQFSLGKLLNHLKVKQWLRECNIVQIQSAKVNVLQFEILLSYIKHPKIKQSKRVPKDIIHVDITLAQRNSRHEGLRNTAIMKEIFESHPSLKVVAFIFKELLKVYELNKPFNGGIGSFALVILIYNILSFEEADAGEDYAQQIITVCKYMTDKFQPFKTLITANRNTILTANPKQLLNIEDPHENVLINTSKIRKMHEIMEMFGGLHWLLKQIEEELLQVGAEERKKMKRIFFQKWEALFISKQNEQIPMEVWGA